MPTGDSEQSPSGDVTEVAEDGLTGRTTTGWQATHRVPQPGDRIAHFIVQDKLGAGGMGVVVRAHDEHLDRTVALKLVRHASDGQETRSRGTERLLAEARAMAKITHPNVITVHEVGVVDGQVFLAMEYIDGQTLGEWASAKQRPWTQIVDRWLEAGRGLAAAHAAGLVHRDFKPSNVLVGRDGRVLVTDFGIAGKLDGLVAELAPESAPARASAPSEDAPARVTMSSLTDRHTGRLTQTGGTLGTPRYMAPEQFLGQAVDARADQFSFCVSLWEAIYGMHPFESSNLPALALAASTGAIREPPRGRGVPDGLRRVLTRGLAPAPDDRHPDVATLLDEIERLRRRLERRRFVAPAVLGVGALVALAWALWPAPAEPPDPCAAPPEGNWIGVWDDQAIVEVAAAIEAAKLPYVRETSPLVQARLTEYTREWDSHQREVCLDTRVRGLVSEQLLDRRMSCLDSAARRVHALVKQLRVRDVDVVDHAIELATQLPSLSDCDDLTRLASDTPLPPPELRAELDAFDEALAHSATLDMAERGDLSIEHLKAWEPRVSALGYPFAEAQLQQAYGNALSGRDNPASCAAYRRAYSRAVAADSVDLATKLALQLATCSVDDDDKATDFWLDVAAAGYEQRGREPHAEFPGAKAYVFRSRRDLPKAEVEALRAIELATDRYLVLKGEANLGAILAEQGKFDEARVHIVRAVELASEEYGPNHQITLKWRSNQIALGAMQGKDFAGVVRDSEKLLAAQEAGLGPDSDSIAVTLTVMGVALRQLEQIERATECDARALAIRERVYGPKHWLTLESLEKLGRDHIAAEQFESGLAELRRMLDTMIELRGPNHLDVGRAWSTLAWALDEAERYDESLDAHRRAIELLVAAVGKEHRSVFDAYGLYGGTLLEAGNAREAEAALREAIELSKPHTVAPRTKAQYLFDLAKARRQQRRKDKAALEPAREALGIVIEHDPEAPIREQIETWLRDQGG